MPWQSLAPGFGDLKKQECEGNNRTITSSEQNTIATIEVCNDLNFLFYFLTYNSDSKIPCISSH